MSSFEKFVAFEPLSATEPFVPLFEEVTSRGETVFTPEYSAMTMSEDWLNDPLMVVVTVFAPPLMFFAYQICCASPLIMTGGPTLTYEFPCVSTIEETVNVLGNQVRPRTIKSPAVFGELKILENVFPLRGLFDPP